MTFVVKAATLSAFRSARDADDESVASRNGRAMDRVAPAIATRGGEFIDRMLMLILCFGLAFVLVGNDFDGVADGRYLLYLEIRCSHSADVRRHDFASLFFLPFHVI